MPPIHSAMPTVQSDQADAGSLSSDALAEAARAVELSGSWSRRTDAETIPTREEDRWWLDEAAATRLARTWRRLRNADGGIPWKWHGLDTRLDTFCRGDLAIFMHPTGGGKSTTADNLAEHWATLGEEIMVFSTEESVEDKSLKMACRTAGIRYGDAKRGRIYGGWRRRLDQAIDAQARLPLSRIHYYDNAAPTAREAARVIEKAARSGITTFVLDHLDVFQTSGKHADWMEKKAFVFHLKCLAVRLRIRILLLVQVMAEPGSGTIWRHRCPSTKNAQGGQGPSMYADIVVAGFQPLRPGLQPDDIQKALLTPDGIVSLVEKDTIVFQVLKFREGLRAEHATPLACWVKNNVITQRDLHSKAMPEESPYERWRREKGPRPLDSQIEMDEDDGSVPDLEHYGDPPF